MKVGTVIAIAFFLVALLGSIAGTSYYYSKSIESTKQEVFEHLETTSQSRAAHIKSYLEEQKIKIRIAQRDNDLTNFLKLAKQGEDYNNLQEEVNSDLNEFLYQDFIEIDLWDADGIVLASTNKNLIGTDYSALDFYKIGKKEFYINLYNDPVSGNDKIGMASPFFDDDGEFLGIYAVLIATDVLNEILLDKTGIGETGETYLINKESYAITPLLFVEDAPLEWKVDTVNSRICLEDLAEHLDEENEEIEEHEDHALTFLDSVGKKVIGAHSYVPIAEWCLLAEIDEAEVLGKQRALFQKVSLTIIIVITIIVTLVGFFIGRFVDNRVVLKKQKKKL